MYFHVELNYLLTLFLFLERVKDNFVVSTNLNQDHQFSSEIIKEMSLNSILIFDHLLLDAWKSFD